MTSDVTRRVGGVTLRPTTAADAVGIAIAARDPSIRDLPWFGANFQDAWAADWVKRAQEEWGSGRSHIFSIIHDDAGYVGSVVLLATRDESREIAYWVTPERRAEGLATAAVLAAVDWAHASFPTIRLWAKTRLDHIASQRVLLKCGFKEKARHRLAYFDYHCSATSGCEDRRQVKVGLFIAAAS